MLDCRQKFWSIDMQMKSTSIFGRDLYGKIAASILAFAVLTASSQVAVPVFSVPMTMQTLAVTLTGVLLGARLGSFITALWVIAGFMGLPTLALGNAGLAAMVGPTAGYLYSFPLIAALAAVLAGKGGVIRVFFAMLVANLACLVVGAAWLAFSIGLEKAIIVGVSPFVIGAFLKSVLGAALIKALKR